MFTTTDLSIASDVTSSAIARLEIISAGSDCYDLLVTFTSSGKVYRYIFEDDATVIKWYDLLSDDVAKAATSWGSMLHRALKHGDIEKIDI